MPGPLPRVACIAENVDVDRAYAEWVQSEFVTRGISAPIRFAAYPDMRHGRLSAAVEETDGCDVLVFYNARYGWDLATFLWWTQIWIWDPEEDVLLAHTSYRSSSGFGKFGGAERTVRRMMRDLLAELTAASPAGRTLAAAELDR